jgi:signal transduction histidine kinase
VIRAGSPGPPGRVAVLHAKPDTAQELARILRTAGHDVSIIGGPMAGTDLVQSAPDLIVGSLTFPDLEPLVGFVRAALAAPDLPLLWVYSGRQDHDETLKGATEVIREPVDAGELALRVGTLLRAQIERRALQRRMDEERKLYGVSWAFSLGGGTEAVYGQLARQSAELVGADKALVFVFEADRREMVGQPQGYGLTPEQVRLARYPVDLEARSLWNFRVNGPLLSNSAWEDPRVLPSVAASLDLRTVIVVPLTRGPQVHGLLLVADRPTPFRDADLHLLQAAAGQVSGVVENIQLHDRIKRANELLQEYDRRKSEFVAIVAHDFRKPLMAIRGFAELAYEEPDLPPETRSEYMRTIVEETDDLARLANDTLLITQMETGQFDYAWREMDLGRFLHDIVARRLMQHSVLVDADDPLPRIWADPERLRQVVTNLTVNAAKYSPRPGSIAVRARERDPQHVVIEVEDQGLGIPPEQMGRLFRKFERVRTEAHLRVSGTGLGLYICRLIVEGHGGRIWADSEPGRGSTFYVLLPVDARAEKGPTPTPATTAGTV